MWIVRAALRRPYTVAVMCLLIVLLGVLSYTRMAIDIFPSIDIPVVFVAWNYPGLSAEDMERRVVIVNERGFSTTVNGIERIESQSIPGIGLIKVYFHPGTDIGGAIAQMNSVANTILRILPPGIQPPIIIQFSAGNVPIVQMTASSKSLSEEKIYDYGFNFIRVRLFTIPGLSVPAPFGGKSRQIMVEIDPQSLSAKGLSPGDVVTALQASNIIAPAGSARMGEREYSILMNSSPPSVQQFGNIPVKLVGGVPVLLGDVARISDGYADQFNIVHVNGKRSAYLTILKKADASALAVVDATRELLPSIMAGAPPGLELKLDFDQSIFVRAAIKNLVWEAVIASILVSLMILIFLGSWRGMLIVSISIPLAVLCAIIGLKLTGNTINLMTLGGLALAIGMLVDDATVAVENIHRHSAMGEPLTVAIINGSQGIALPALVSTLAICIVFFPVVLLFGAARYLFTPLAVSVVIAMLASYVLSRTLVPALTYQLTLGGMHEDPQGKGKGAAQRVSNKVKHAVEWWFSHLREAYGKALNVVLRHRPFSLLVSAGIVLITAVLATLVGMDFYPSADVGLMKIHVRGPVGTRLEETEKLTLRVEDRIRQLIPADELDSINDLIGVPVFYNLAFVPTDNVSGMDAEILISLKGKHRPTADYMRKLRVALRTDFPATGFYFMPADIVAQVLNFGLSAPVDIQIQGPDIFASYEIAKKIRDRVRSVPGTADTHIIQALDYPALRVDVDRLRAAKLGLSQRDITNSTLIALSSSSLVAPSYFLNPANNVNYPVAVQVPQLRITSVPTLLATALDPPSGGALSQSPDPASLSAAPGAPVTTLGNVATVTAQSTLAQVSHYTLQRVIDVAANLDGRDLGSVVDDIKREIADIVRDLPKTMKIIVRGQDEVMRESFGSLVLGLVLAVVLVYFLMAVLFQSWLDPFIIMMAVPGALVGIVWMLAATGTTFNVVSLMGSIMSIGISVANSILLVSFANDLRIERHMSALQAAAEAGKTRLRPVLMTALAMIIGMVPMALGTGEAGEQNAPLGRAVIGGLLVATFTTLFLVPVFYSLLRRKLPAAHLYDERFRSEMAAGNTGEA